MCFSPQASFAAAGALAPVAAVALHRAGDRRALALAALPALFAAHQAVEGVVWLGIDGRVSPAVLDLAVHVYLAFAQVVLPVLVPVALWRLEPAGRRRRWVAALGVVGIAAAARLLWNLVTEPVAARALDHVITYDSDVHLGTGVAIAYVTATCGPALISSVRPVRCFGVANLLALAVATAVHYAAVTSVWCFYAAWVSGGIVVLLGTRTRSASGWTPMRV
jgi:hypothetical protein